MIFKHFVEEVLNSKFHIKGILILWNFEIRNKHNDMKIIGWLWHDCYYKTDSKKVVLSILTVFPCISFLLKSKWLHTILYFQQ